LLSLKISVFEQTILRSVVIAVATMIQIS